MNECHGKVPSLLWDVRLRGGLYKTGIIELAGWWHERMIFYSALKLQMSTFIMSWTLWCRIINKSSRQNKINKFKFNCQDTFLQNSNITELS